MCASDGTAWTLGREGTHEVVSEADRRGRPLRTVICMKTGLVRNDPIPDDATLARFYAEEYRVAYKGSAKPRRRQILRNFRRAAIHVQAFRDVLDGVDRVLDIGAGSGEFAYLMKLLGKSVAGIEPDSGYAAFCREHLGLDVRPAHLAPDLFPPARFDLIHMNHVLEHLNDPIGSLDRISRWLAPDGLLYIAVPNIETYCRSKSRGRMFHFAHIFNFNPWTLRTCASLAGLSEAPETVARSADTTNVFFRRDVSAAGDTVTENSENAEHVRALIHAHYDGAFGKGKAAGSFRRIAARVEETLTGLILGSPATIGNHLAQALRRPTSLARNQDVRSGRGGPPPGIS